MLTIDNQKISVDQNREVTIKENVSNHTYKTNINPQFIFRSNNLYGQKDFFGNWTNDGFWISLSQPLMPIVVAKFKLSKDLNKTEISINYSFAFLSMLIVLFWILLLSLIFLPLSVFAFLIVFLFLIFFKSLFDYGNIRF